MLTAARSPRLVDHAANLRAYASIGRGSQLGGIEAMLVTKPISAGEVPPGVPNAPGSSPLPPGLKLSSKGVISGKATKVGTYSFTVQVVDKKSKSKPPTQNTATATATATLSITIG